MVTQCLTLHCCELWVSPSLRVCRYVDLLKMIIKRISMSTREPSCAWWFDRATALNPRGFARNPPQSLWVGRWDWLYDIKNFRLVFWHWLTHTHTLISYLPPSKGAIAHHEQCSILCFSVSQHCWALIIKTDQDWIALVCREAQREWLYGTS